MTTTEPGVVSPGEMFSIGGGVAGHVAMTEDLRDALLAISTAAAYVGEATGHAKGALAGVQDIGPTLGTATPDPDTPWRLARAENALAAILASPSGTRRAEDALLDIGDRLRATVLAMEAAETSAHRGISPMRHVLEAAKDLWGLVGYVPRTALAAVWSTTGPSNLMRLFGGDPVLDAIAPGAPDTTGLLNRDVLEMGPGMTPEYYRAIAAAFAWLGGVMEWAAREPGVAVRPRDGELDLQPPRSLADLIRVERATEELGGGSVVVQTVSSGSGDRYIVTIPGTSDVTLWAENPFDWTSNGEVMAGEVSEAMLATQSAMEAAGIPPGADVMFVGHSQGGIAAMALASWPAFTERFHVTHVVTTGAPVASFTLASGVTSLHLEHAEDIVPALDLKPNANGAHQTTFSHAISQSADPRLRQLGQELLSAHSLEGYIATAELAESGVSTSVDAFVASAKGFFDPEAAVTASAYEPVAVRPPPSMGGVR